MNPYLQKFTQFILTENHGMMVRPSGWQVTIIGQYHSGAAKLHDKILVRLKGSKRPKDLQSTA